jgi:hypothetical protein
MERKSMRIYAFLGLLCLMLIHPFIAPAAVETQTTLADLFSMEGRDMVIAPEHLGIMNGKLTVGTPGGHAGRVDGLWAPPFVSSDFVLRLEVLGREVPTPGFRWWPYKIEQRGQAEGIEVSAATVLALDKRGGLAAIALRNTTPKALQVPLVFKTRGTLDYRSAWEFAAAASSTATQPSAEKGTLTLAAGEQSIVVQGGGDGLTWDATSRSGTQTLALAAGRTAKVYLAFAIGPSAEAKASCRAIIAEPERAIAAATAGHARRIEDLFQRIPRLVSDNKAVEKLYNRSLVHAILNRWDVPEFVLHPYYSTGSIRGGCVTEYLWNYGESWELMPLYDPTAHREHIKQFLKCDMTAHFAFNPIDGKAHGPWYMVNQEKIIGLVYRHVKITGDTAFLQEVVEGKTVLEHVLKNAVVRDDTSKPVALIDYGPSNSHLELRRQYTYNHVMPDLNGRRYANYLHAARLAEIGGKPAPQLLERAAALKALLKEKLWNPQTKWFDFINGKGQRETRWTVQMFYLFGGGVLDSETESGLASHLNDQEFLGEYGLHSLAKGDPAYDPADVDNGGPGACTCFPPNIGILLYQAGRTHEAEDIMRRCLWWGSRMPYWGDSSYADRIDYRHDTPLQCTIDGVTVAQFFIFGLFGVDPQFDGTILVSPRPAAFAPRAALRGVKMRDAVFDIELGDKEYKVLSGGKTFVAPLGGTIRLDPKIKSL